MVFHRDPRLELVSMTPEQEFGRDGRDENVADENDDDVDDDDDDGGADDDDDPDDGDG